MKKTYLRPETELLDVKFNAIMLTTSPGSPADSTSPVLSKGRNFVNFAEEEDEVLIDE